MLNNMSFEDWEKLDPKVKEFENFRMLKDIEKFMNRRKWVNPALVIMSSFSGGFAAVWTAFKFKVLG